MSFSDNRTPPPAWAVESTGTPDASGRTDHLDAADSPPVQPAGATVISLRTRRRTPPPPGPQAGSGGASEGASATISGSSGNAGSPRIAGSPGSPDAEPDPIDWAREIVLRMLTGSPKTRSQLADGLRRRDCPVEVIETVLDRLEDVGLIDDAEFAANFVRHQQVARGLSGRALQQRLRAKGIDAATAAAALDEVDPALEEDQARALVEKKLRAMSGLDRTVQTRRLAGMLARKGYGSELTMRVIREALAQAPEHQRD